MKRRGRKSGKTFKKSSGVSKIKYIDFINQKYRPTKNDLICLFRVEPAKGIKFEEAVGRVASESSNGTWTDVSIESSLIKELAAKAYYIKPPWTKIAYPHQLFEEGNMSQILSSIAGNIFGMKAVKKLRLEDIYWPETILNSFRGPTHGLRGVRKILKIYDRPITATVPKPKVGLTTNEYIDVAKEIWLGGVDLIKDDENLTNQSYIKFSERVKKMFRLRDKIERETGERKSYLINITAPYKEMIRRAKLVNDYGGEFVMIDILTVGWSALQSFRDINEEYQLAIHAHRAFHAAFTRDRRHGVSMKVIAEVARIIGVDQIHVGTVVGKLESPLTDVKALIQICRETRIKENMKIKILKKDWGKVKPIFPVSSGGIHPGLIPKIIEIFGNDLIIQVGGGVLGHPGGPRAGAKAVRDALEATINNINLEEASKHSRELREALDKWGYKTPI